MEIRGKKGKIWVKLATIQSRIRQNENALICARKTRQKREKNVRKREQKVQEKKKKGVMY